MTLRAEVKDKARHFDLIVIGGGIHGLMVATVAAERGYRPVLLEKAEMGGATTHGWFAILHGGLRYLQSLDLRRYRESIKERRWFLRRAGNQLEILPFLLPLYGQGLKRNGIFRLAFLLDALLSFDRNHGTTAKDRLKSGQVIRPGTVREAFSAVRAEGLRGGAIWQEAIVPNGGRLFETLVNQARTAGVTIFDQTKVTGLLTAAGRVKGVSVTQADAGTARFHAPAVLNASGPWAEDLAQTLDGGYAPQFGRRLAFNLILNLPPPSALGVSVAPRDRAKDMLFLYPMGDQTFAGTWYVPFDGDADAARVAEADVQAFIAALNVSMEGYEIKRSDVAAVKSGLLPTISPGNPELLGRNIVIGHETHGGPMGLFTQIGVKFTTARSLARQTLDKAGLR
jgi:glycerol-3-phosphate dehydrogenase